MGGDKSTDSTGKVFHLLRSGQDVDRFCCYGSVVYDSCTCWVPEYDLDQEPAKPFNGVVSNARPCDDCASKVGSPESLGDPQVQPCDLKELASIDKPFWCHKGMRRVIRYVHPDGSIEDAGQYNYSPLVADGVPRKHDGTPAEICSAWAKMHENKSKAGA